MSELKLRPPKLREGFMSALRTACPAGRLRPPKLRDMARLSFEAQGKKPCRHGS